MDWDNTVRRGKSLLVVAAEVGGTGECSNHWLDAYVLSINSVGCIIASLCHSNPVSTFVLHGDRSAAVSIQSIKDVSLYRRRRVLIHLPSMTLQWCASCCGRECPANVSRQTLRANDRRLPAQQHAATACMHSGSH